MENKIVNLQVNDNINETNKSLGTLKSQLRDAQNEVNSLSEKFGATSREAVEAAKQAAVLKDKIGDAKTLTDAFNPDAKFKALTSSLSGVAGGFAAVQGGMALFGAETEEVEKTLLKVQSAMALSQGLQSIGESIDSFKQLGAVINSTTGFQKLNTLATAAAAAVQKLFTGAVNTTATSFNVLKTAIVSTGIGALVVGIGYLISKMNENADATEKLTLEQESLNKQLEITKKLTDDNAKAIDYDTQIKLANAKKVGASEKELLRIQLDGYEAKGKANNKEIEEIQKSQSKSINLTKEQNKRIQDLREQNLDLQRKGNVEIANSDADLANKQRELSKKAGEESSANKKKNREEREAEAKRIKEEKEEIQKASFELEKNAVTEQLKNNKISIDEKRNIVLNDNKLSKEDRQNFLLDLQQQEIQLEDAHNKAIGDLNKRYDDEKATRLADTAVKKEELDYNRKLLEINGIAQTELEKQTLIEKLDGEHKVRMGVAATADKDALIKIEELKTQAKQKALSAYSTTLKTAANLLGESTDAGKAAAIAATTIDTIQSGVSAFKGMVSSVPGPVGIGLGVVAAAGALASGFASVKKILAVQTPSGGGGGGGSIPSAPTMTAPSFNVVGQGGANQIAQGMANQEQAPVQAYVVAGAVTSGQALNRNIINNASMG